MNRYRRAVLVAVVIAALTLGVPIGLAALVGNPLPSGVPTLEELGRALTAGDVSERTLLKTLASVCWLAWFELMVALAAEGWAIRRGRPTPRVPFLGAVQAVAAVLLASVAPLVGMLARSERAAEPPPLARALSLSFGGPDADPVADEAAPRPQSVPPTEAPRDAAGDAPETPGGVHRVARRETLWSIAEQRLGDARRWRDLFDLNHGAPQPDGGALARPDEPLREGWLLRLPADATSPDPLPPTPAEFGADPLPSAPPEVVDLSRVRPASTSDDLPVREGSMLDGLARAGLLVGGIVWSIDRRRRAAEGRRLPGEAVASPADSTRAVEMSLRAAATPDRLRQTEVALRRWSASLRGEGRPAPPVVGVNVADELSILFAAPDRVAVDGFSVEDDGLSWVTPLSDVPGATSGETVAAHPLPCLVTIGHTDRSQVLINPEMMDVLAVVGREWDVAEVMFAMASELTTGPSAEHVKVMVVDPDGSLGTIPDAVRACGLSEIEHALELAAGGPAGQDAMNARIRGTASPVSATVVFVTRGADDDASHLADLAHQTPGAGLSVVVAHGASLAGWSLAIDDDVVRLEPVGVTLTRPRIPERARPVIRELLTPTRRGPEAAPSLLLLNPSPPSTEPEPAVEVCVLGPVGVRGVAAPIERRKALEFVVYLALHRRGAEADVVSEALWPDRFASPRTLHGVATVARRALGAGPSGEPLLPHAGSESHYRLDPSVALDSERFAALVRDAATATPEAAASHLRAALSLVSGRPFTVPGGEYLWVHAEALLTAVVAEVADAAHRLARLCLDAGDARGAWWATQQGLRASPGNEQLHRDRMLTADLSGNPAGVEEVIDELCRALEVTRADMHDALHPLTVELYDRLARRSVGRSFAARGL